MPRTEPPSHADATAFYKAALAAAQRLDAEATDKLFDDNADAAWRAYGSDLPVLMRLELVLKNLAALYPAAFAPGPVFDLSGWYDDDPWGTGFARPAKDELEALWRRRSAPESTDATLAAVADVWSLASPAQPADVVGKLAPSTNLIVAGPSAMASLASAFVREDNLQARSQLLLGSDRPAARHLLGITCALGREQGVPQMIAGTVDSPQKAADAAGFHQAAFAVISADASAEERATAEALATALAVEQRIEVGAA